MAVARDPLIASVLRFAAALRFPTLFASAAVLFLLDWLIPDSIAFADAIPLGLVTLMLGTLERRKDAPG